MTKTTAKHWPIRVALQEALIGLIPQIPVVQSDDAAPTSMTHLHWMMVHALRNYHIWPIDKTSRWIGFVQGVLAARGFLNVDAERDRTRPIFHEAYRQMGETIPAAGAPTERAPLMHHKTAPAII